jgi:hypothetical protein
VYFTSIHSGQQNVILASIYLVVTKVTERLIVSKQTAYRFHMERFNLKKLNEIEYLVEISNRFATLENYAEVDINRAWETIGENIKVTAKENLVGYYELKKYKPWFDEGS